MSSNPEEVPVDSPIESLSSVSKSPENGKPALEELGGEVTDQPKLLGSESSEAMSPESGKFVMPHEGTKATAPPQPTTVTAGDINITVSPKPESKKSSGSTITSSSMGGIAKETSDTKQRIKDNRAFIHEKTEELERLRYAIQEMTKENKSLSMEFIRVVESKEAKVGDVKKKIEELNMEVVEMRDETRDMQNDAKEAREKMESMFHFRDNFEKVGTSSL
mmetsp:Transcript_40191/g.72409  ORF Transcript_40191/g.72409 Transcript_40191/m.72409 type:complete len:220 (-) Transcript_40191:1285-1944(-)